jgi:dTDP-4-dehydrorhamnose reductase
MRIGLLDNGQPRLPLLITGITGVAGYSAFHYFRRRYPGQVVGIRPRVTWQLQGENIVAQDADDPIGVRELFRRHGFRSVLNTVGNCALKSCQVDPKMARQINIVSAGVMAENARTNRARLVHLSTDLVFSGTRGGNHRETDRVDPVSVYGRTMVEGEALVSAILPEAAILRISLPMGQSFNRHAGAIDWIDSRFRNNRPATLYFDEVRSSTYCEDLDRVFERFLAGDEQGIYHLGGPRPLALYQIAQIINRVGGYAPQLLNGCQRVQAGPVPPRAGNVSMNSDKLITLLGHNPLRPWPRDDDLVPQCRHWHGHRSEEERGCFQQIARKLYRHSALELAPVEP